MPPQAFEWLEDNDTLEEVVVMGSRIRRADSETAQPLVVMVAKQEDLGDLKLYSVPEAVTVNAHGQKQVALMVKPVRGCFVVNGGGLVVITSRLVSRFGVWVTRCFLQIRAIIGVILRFIELLFIGFGV
jgi:hypothetical protein